VAPEHREAVFERFRQIEGGSARRFGGTGLGLAIARDFVQLHGGTVSVSDAPEGGALFTVELPMLPPPGVMVRARAPDRLQLSGVARPILDELVAREDRPVPLPADAFGRPLVLVIDDNSDMNRFVCDSLAGDYGVEPALDGNEGLEKALALRPDLIVCDVMMPETSGDEFVRAVRGHRDLGATPIVMLTAKADDDLRVRLLREGVSDYVMKPFSVEELRARVGNLVDSKLAQERNRQLNVELHDNNLRLQGLAAELQEANRELETFSYSVAHDLRTPLLSVGGFSQLLLEDQRDRLDEDGREYVRRIRAAGQRMGQLIDDLLEFSRVTRVELHHSNIDLSALARVVLELLKRMEPDRAVEIVVEDGHVAQGDPHLLRIVLENLLGNAWKYTGKADLPRIEFGVSCVNRETCYFVRDNGVGFDMAYAEQLFEPFQRLHTGDDFPGTGIGLATVKRIIQRHGGEVWAEAGEGGGATFSFMLPVVELGDRR
jgi:signal transduction histidine kinase